jgi:hypothetical protein
MKSFIQEDKHKPIHLTSQRRSILGELNYAASDKKQYFFKAKKL